MCWTWCLGMRLGSLGVLDLASRYETRPLGVLDLVSRYETRVTWCVGLGV